MNKIVIIGTGFVGSSIAYALSLRNQVQQIILINREVEPSLGEMLDINHGFKSLGASTVIVGDYSMISDADLIIISAGRNRKPGETRLELANENALIIQDIASNIKPYYTKGKILLITNPVDVLTQWMSELMDLPNILVIGSGTLLDTSRLRYALQEEDKSNDQELLIGEHGDGIMPLAWSFDKNSKFMTDEHYQINLLQRVRGLGATIIQSKGKTQFGIATCVSYFVEALQSNQPKLMAVSLPLKDQLGLPCSLSVPVSVSHKGIELRTDLISSSEWIQLKEVATSLHKVLELIRS
jgi:L-lactate dehydrogenase